jgi:hypothetical protein
LNEFEAAMTRQILIDNILRQTTILIAQLATSGGVRSPLAQIADRVFLDLAHELDAQGISRRVSADMFGMALRSYRRRVRQLSESSTVQGRTLWEAILDYLSGAALVTREQVLKRFHRDEEVLVKGVLNDLCESGLVFRLGSGKGVAYRAATAEELATLRTEGDGLSEFVWILVYREGPITEADICSRTSLKPERLKQCIEQLVSSGRIESTDAGWRSSRVVLPVGASTGWEAAFFDHYQAVVKTLCARLQRNGDGMGFCEAGGSTYSYSVWPGHPFEDEVRVLLQEFRTKHSALRERIKAHNDQHPTPPKYHQVTLYAGIYSSLQEEDGDLGDDEES